ncbi:sulfur carrier protein ThiS adenylyltransferase ThiF [bacterium]|nr:sulfur carrier protein ThiS adenylyltransferase ThiF [bacterium]MBU1024746.1 sulfur carrier protein ThiS adenylyltransferase ThiF [bacterium]
MDSINVERICASNAPGSLPILKKKCVGIAGAGGLGSNVAIMLARSGIGKLIVVDYDDVEIENLNRQHFFLEHVGKPKVEALGEIIKKIVPGMNYVSSKVRLTEENIAGIFGEVDVLVEALDKAYYKAVLIDSWVALKNNRPIIAVSGVAGYGKIDKIKVKRMGNLTIIGDFESNQCDGMMAPRITLVASMQAALTIEYLMEQST